MTIDIRTGGPVIYICPRCENATRGLQNGMCAKCVKQYDGIDLKVLDEMHRDMDAGTFSFGDLS